MNDGAERGDSDGRSLLDRALNVVTEVRAGEGVTALLLTLNVFLLLSAYYFIKPVREGLILAMPSGAEYKSYLSAVISASLLFAVPAYAWVASRVAKHKLVVGVTLFFASHLALFWLLSKVPAAEKNIGIVFFVWVGIFNMMVVAQFWSFANDIYTVEQGKRLFALVGMGASIGGAVGAKLTGFLLTTIKLGVYELLLVSALLLLGSAVLTSVAHARERRINSSGGKEEQETEEREGAFRMVFKHRYLILIAAFSLVFTWVNTNGEYMLSVLFRAEAAAAAKAAGIVEPAAIGRHAKAVVTGYYANFFLWVNVFSVLLQTFVVSRIVKFGGLRIGFFVFPIIALVDAAALIVLPAALRIAELAVLRPGKIAENSTDYSLNNTVRNMLWLPTTREMKYKGKQAVDTFFVRMGDVASAVLVYVGAQLLHLPIRGFAVVNGVLVVFWLFLAGGIVRINRKMTDGAA